MNASHGDSATPNLRKFLEVAAKYSGLYPFAFFFGGGSALPSLQGTVETWGMPPKDGPKFGIPTF